MKKVRQYNAEQGKYVLQGADDTDAMVAEDMGNAVPTSETPILVDDQGGSSQENVGSANPTFIHKPTVLDPPPLPPKRRVFGGQAQAEVYRLFLDMNTQTNFFTDEYVMPNLSLGVYDIGEVDNLQRGEHCFHYLDPDGGDTFMAVRAKNESGDNFQFLQYDVYLNTQVLEVIPSGEAQYSYHLPAAASPSGNNDWFQGNKSLNYFSPNCLHWGMPGGEKTILLTLKYMSGDGASTWEGFGSIGSAPPQTSPDVFGVGQQGAGFILDERGTVDVLVCGTIPGTIQAVNSNPVGGFYFLSGVYDDDSVMGSHTPPGSNSGTVARNYFSTYPDKTVATVYNSSAVHTSSCAGSGGFNIPIACNWFSPDNFATGHTCGGSLAGSFDRSDTEVGEYRTIKLTLSADNVYQRQDIMTSYTMSGGGVGALRSISGSGSFSSSGSGTPIIGSCPRDGGAPPIPGVRDAQITVSGSATGTRNDTFFNAGSMTQLTVPLDLGGGFTSNYSAIAEWSTSFSIGASPSGGKTFLDETIMTGGTLNWTYTSNLGPGTAVIGLSTESYNESGTWSRSYGVTAINVGNFPLYFEVSNSFSLAPNTSTTRAGAVPFAVAGIETTCSVNTLTVSNVSNLARPRDMNYALAFEQQIDNGFFKRPNAISGGYLLAQASGIQPQPFSPETFKWTGRNDQALPIVVPANISWLGTHRGETTVTDDWTLNLEGNTLPIDTSFFILDPSGRNYMATGGPALEITATNIIVRRPGDTAEITPNTIYSEMQIISTRGYEPYFTDVLNTVATEFSIGTPVPGNPEGLAFSNAGEVTGTDNPALDKLSDQDWYVCVLDDTDPLKPVYTLYDCTLTSYSLGNPNATGHDTLDHVNDTSDIPTDSANAYYDGSLFHSDGQVSPSGNSGYLPSRLNTNRVAQIDEMNFTINSVQTLDFFPIPGPNELIIPMSKHPNAATEADKVLITTKNMLALALHMTPYLTTNINRWYITNRQGDGKASDPSQTELLGAAFDFDKLTGELTYTNLFKYAVPNILTVADDLAYLCSKKLTKESLAFADKASVD